MFVGTTALGTREVVATPLDTLFAGVEVQATVADNLLQQDFIRRPEHGVHGRDADRAGARASSRRSVVGRFGLAVGRRRRWRACLARVWGGAICAAVGTAIVPVAAVSDARPDRRAFGADGARRSSRSSAAAPTGAVEDTAPRSA